jgi:two-component system chemotaxis sensor kinase CheA
MADRNQDIKARLLATFRVEAQEHLQVITANLLVLDRELSPSQVQDAVETTFREVHTLKGAARSVGYKEVEALCQALESVLSRVTRGQLSLSPALRSLLNEGADAVAALMAGGLDPTAMRELMDRLEQAPAEAAFGGQGPGVRDQPLTPSPHPLPPDPATETIRLATAKLDALLLQIEDLLVPKLAAAERVREARALVEGLEAGAGGQRLGAREYGPRRLDRSPAPSPQPLTPKILAQTRDLLTHLAADQRALAGVVDDLLDGMRGLRLMPASTILDLFPRMVRDLAREQGKDVEWGVQGADLEVDRRVLEAIKDPLIHLVRNSLDHGIEPPETRRQAGKPPRGRVAVTVTALEGHRIEIRVEDDGAGIDLARVRAAAVRSRLLTTEATEALSDEAALDLIFRSGLSTSPIITDVSGYGLGLAIVKERVERLGGQLHIQTRPGAGTSVQMLLPASIATFRGLLVRAGGQPFLLPTDAVERATRIALERIESVEGRDTIRWNGAPLSVARLGDILGLRQEQGPGARGKGSGTSPQSPVPDPQPPTPSPQPQLPCVVVGAGEQRAAFLVEEILGNQEVLLKELRPPLVRVRNVAGAGLLGTGQVVLILRPADLLRSLREMPSPPAARPTPERTARQNAILVVDDSITTRTMERNILEGSGYRVRVAADGIEAWTLLKSEDFDLVVSDVDMPRMDGFTLTERIRADKKLADLPVVLVTALESREDKERGIDVGANAYVVKSSFDQSNLLEIIRRLL